MQEENEVRRVEICDRIYAVTGAIDGDYLDRLSAYVDGKMREIQESSRTVDTVKVAVMAALNIADELFRQRDQAERADAAIADRSSRCSEMIEALLPE
ncbi:MAG: cell division protein ZapA [Acidobacteriota bacterium]|nr:cell division protein ZapA [Acidobacteriota bacterium]MDE2965204.1 cell division protein ZapA [Acidobacteriota bacterium]